MYFLGGKGTKTGFKVLLGGKRTKNGLKVLFGKKNLLNMLRAILKDSKIVGICINYLSHFKGLLFLYYGTKYCTF